MRNRNLISMIYANLEKTSAAAEKAAQINARLMTSVELPTDVSAPQIYDHHCHIVEDEDNDMMRPFSVVP